ncbi:pilus assembly FimT family protein [Acinetobacter sp. F16]|uniref:pilus assembly FimT family protein n=1 Tax=Acinetobacter sp. F16 TaxID=3462438 RepID=UPI004046F45E
MQRKEQGFTLIELMITIAIFAIISMMAAPSFGDMMLSQNLNKSTQNLILTLNEARSQAVTKRMSFEIYLVPENKDYQDIVDNNLTAVQRDNLTRKTFFLWKPEGKAQLKTGVPISLLFDFNGGVCISDSGNPAKCLRPLDQNTDVFQICNKSGGTKSKTVRLSRMGTIQQTTEGTCS